MLSLAGSKSVLQASKQALLLQALFAGKRPDLLPTTTIAVSRRRGSVKSDGKSRRSAVARVGIATAAAALLLFVVLIVLPTLPPWRLRPRHGSVDCQQGRVVVSLATVAQRLGPGGSFPVALRALLRQTAGECASIWVFIPEQDRPAAQVALPALDAAARRAGRPVHLHFVPDR